jgi:hypothetical protein
MTLKGEDGELELMERVIKTYPTGIVACVFDEDENGTKTPTTFLSR